MTTWPRSHIGARRTGSGGLARERVGGGRWRRRRQHENWTKLLFINSYRQLTDLLPHTLPHTIGEKQRHAVGGSGRPPEFVSVPYTPKQTSVHRIGCASQNRDFQPQSEARLLATALSKFALPAGA